MYIWLTNNDIVKNPNIQIKSYSINKIKVNQKKIKIMYINQNTIIRFCLLNQYYNKSRYIHGSTAKRTFKKYKNVRNVGVKNIKCK